MGRSVRDDSEKVAVRRRGGTHVVEDEVESVDECLVPALELDQLRRVMGGELRVLDTYTISHHQH